MHSVHPCATGVAFLATLVAFFAIAQFAAMHHLRPDQQQQAASRGNEMTTVLARLASAMVAVSLSGAMLSLALV